MDSNAYAELFLTESREHVSAINHSLLALERGLTSGSGGDGAARAQGVSTAVAAIFRAVHTIKGMAATMGFASVTELSHEMETVLDLVRRDELSVHGDLLDLLFRASDALESSVESAVGGDGKAGDGFTGIVAALRETTAIVPGGTEAMSGAPRDLASGPGTLVRVTMMPETPLRGVRAFMVVEAMRRLGEVTATSPSIQEIKAGAFGDSFVLRLETTADDEEIERTVRRVGDVAEVLIRRRGASANAPPAATHPERRKSGPRAAVAAGAGSGPGVRRPTPVSSSVVVSGGPSTNRSSASPQRHVRMDLRRLDNLMNLIGELVIARGRLTQLSTELGDGALGETVEDTSRLIMELRDEITASRLVPAWQMFDRFPRIVRDASRGLGKQVDLVIEGQNIELDRSMLEEIGDSIVHLLRNAIDHGIEAPDERRAAGKPDTGHIMLSAARDRSAVVIKVSDDGRGINRERVLARAKADGLVESSKTDLTEDELLRLLARPGFSTAERVTDLSGRGVGVDAVYTRVRALGGAMDIRSVPGQGTTIVLRLPLTLAIVRALLARVADETYAIPLAHVSATIELEPDTVRTVKGREVLLGTGQTHDEVLPLLRLRSLVGLPVYTRRGAIDLEQVVVLDVGDRRAALVVDELTAQEEIVVKQYDAVRDGLPFFGGATLLGDGTPSLIIDVSSLL
ncbi:MAG TPA: chemotaxis protein CheA [Gemmatimonadaceae bacterium]